jgi:hypothetical protein
MRKQKKFKQRVKFTSGTDRPKDEQAKEQMAEALAAYQGPIPQTSVHARRMSDA